VKILPGQVIVAALGVLAQSTLRFAVVAFAEVMV